MMILNTTAYCTIIDHYVFEQAPVCVWLTGVEEALADTKQSTAGPL